MLKPNITFFVLLAGALALPAYAQTTTPTDPTRIDKRQERQDKRIEQGKQSGSLTDKEAAKQA